MRWELGPFFAKSLADFKSFSTFNAKAKTINKQPAWREPFTKGRRCLIHMDGFYEWKVLDPDRLRTERCRREPPYVFPVEGAPLALASL